MIFYASLPLTLFQINLICRALFIITTYLKVSISQFRKSTDKGDPFFVCA
jgi:hypothetical protein